MSRSGLPSHIQLLEFGLGCLLHKTLLCLLALALALAHAVVFGATRTSVDLAREPRTNKAL